MMNIVTAFPIAFIIVILIINWENIYNLYRHNLKRRKEKVYCNRCKHFSRNGFSYLYFCSYVLKKILIKGRDMPIKHKPEHYVDITISDNFEKYNKSNKCPYWNK